MSFNYSQAGAVVVCICLLLGCAPLSTAQADEAAAASVGMSPFGSYLAGRIARTENDHRKAAEYIGNALARTPNNFALIKQSFYTEAAMGNIARASELAGQIIRKEKDNRIARMLLGVWHFKHNRHRKALAHFGAIKHGPIEQLSSVLSSAWTYQDMHKTRKAINLLQSENNPEWSAPYRNFHLAMLHDVSGHKKSARAIYADLMEKDPRNMRIMEAYARHLAKHGLRKRALQVVEHNIQVNDRNGVANIIHSRLAASGAAEHTIRKMVATPVDGMAEVYYGIGEALAGEGGIDTGFVYLQLALFLKPEFPAARMAIAQVYEQTGKYQLANEVYDRIDEEAPVYMDAMVHKSINLSSLEKVGEAFDILQKLKNRYPAEIQPHAALGDVLRSNERYAEAIAHYSAAIATLGEDNEKSNWRYYYARGVCYERTDNWALAEEDLKKAITLDPEQPLALNYLGYSWVDNNINIDEAIDLIRKAIKLSPDDGYFIDSLGWAHYRMGHYEEAVRQLERAIEILPDDPVINDHLGDAYWRVNRRLEARYQWSQAIELKASDDIEVDVVRKKLENGLPDILHPRAASSNGALLHEKQ
jgi:tetratricopeptide (TPR) repeat protein